MKWIVLSMMAVMLASCAEIKEHCGCCHKCKYNQCKESKCEAKSEEPLVSKDV